MRKTVLMLFAAVLFCAAAAAEPVQLRYRFTEGDVMYYGLEAETSGTLKTEMAAGEMSRANQEIPLDMTTGMTWRFDVKDVGEKGVATVVSTIEKYKLAKGGMIISSYEPGKGEEGAAPPGMKAMLEPLTMKMDSRGIVHDVEGLQQAAALSADFDMKSLLSRLQMPLPEEPVDVGQKWTQETNLGADEIEGAGAAKLVSHYEFLGYETVKEIRCAKLHVDFQGDMSELAGEMMGGMSAPSAPEIDFMNISFSGDIYFAPDAGVTVAVEFVMDQDISAVMDVPAQGKVKKMRIMMDMRLDGHYALQ